MHVKGKLGSCCVITWTAEPVFQSYEQTQQTEQDWVFCQHSLPLSSAYQNPYPTPSKQKQSDVLQQNAAFRNHACVWSLNQTLNDPESLQEKEEELKKTWNFFFFVQKSMGWLAKKESSQLSYPQSCYNSPSTSREHYKAISSLCLTKTPLKDNIIASSRFLKHTLLPLKYYIVRITAKSCMF